MNRRNFLKSALAIPLPMAPLLAQARASDPASLKIRRVDPYVLRIGGRSDLVCVRIETEEGINGWGEGTTRQPWGPWLRRSARFRSC